MPMASQCRRFVSKNAKKNQVIIRKIALDAQTWCLHHIDSERRTKLAFLIGESFIAPERSPAKEPSRSFFFGGGGRPRGSTEQLSQRRSSSFEELALALGVQLRNSPPSAAALKGSAWPCKRRPLRRRGRPTFTGRKTTKKKQTNKRRQKREKETDSGQPRQSISKTSIDWDPRRLPATRSFQFPFLVRSERSFFFPPLTMKCRAMLPHKEDTHHSSWKMNGRTVPSDGERRTTGTPWSRFDWCNAVRRRLIGRRRFLFFFATRSHRRPVRPSSVATTNAVAPF